MLGNFLGFLISGLAIPLHSFMGVLVGRSIAGATAGSLPIAQAAMIDISEDSQKASRLGLVVLANVSGFAIGPVIGGFFMDQNIFNHINYQIPFFISCGMALVGALLLGFSFKETFLGNKQLKINIFTSFSNLHQAFTAKETLTYCAVLFCFLFGWAILFSTLPVFLTERLNWSGSLVGYFITYIGVLFGVIVIGIMPKITKLFSLSSIVFCALITLFICNAIFPSIHNSLFPWIVILLTAAVPFTYVGIVTLLSSEVDSQKQGQIMGVTGSIFAFTWGVGPMLAGFILKLGLTTPYILAGIFFLLAALLFRQQKLKNEKIAKLSIAEPVS
jgi:predicted MFS family arabinose efflux permease